MSPEGQSDGISGFRDTFGYPLSDHQYAHAMFHSAAERGCHEAGRSCCAVGGLSRRPPQAALLSLTALPGVDSNILIRRRSGRLCSAGKGWPCYDLRRKQFSVKVIKNCFTANNFKGFDQEFGTSSQTVLASGKNRHSDVRPLP